ncbi:MAG: nucleoside phosphorylase domain-containing protein [Linnemannia gamsii]|nr:MAG: nucleoside phosphorylase domain-containing protein [Linnemannia gamsii]
MSMSNANFPMDPEGRTYHVGIKRGELANRIITVGDPARAIVLSRSLDGVDPTTPAKTVPANLFSHASHRGFLTVTGRYKGTPVSIVAIGMGVSMMDFFVRECRAVVDGPMIMIRLGSCGSLSDAKVGDICVPSSSYLVQRNYDYFADDASSTASPYILSKKFDADPEVTAMLVKNMSAQLGDNHVWKGVNATADSFYSSQGRQDENFIDNNQELFTDLVKHEPDTLTLEMETFLLYHLARTSTVAPLKEGSRLKQEGTSTQHSIRAGACMMVFAQRKSNEFISKDDVVRVEPLAGKAVFDSLVEVTLGEESELHATEGSVWAL